MCSIQTKQGSVNGFLLGDSGYVVALDAFLSDVDDLDGLDGDWIISGVLEAVDDADSVRSACGGSFIDLVDSLLSERTSEDRSQFMIASISVSVGI